MDTSTSETVIRPAVVDDDVALAHLDASAWDPAVEVVPAGDATSPFFSGHRKPEDFIVVTEGGSIVGYVQLARHVPVAKNDHVLHVNALAVAPSHRGRGLSHRLVDAAIDEARRRGARKLGLRALSTNSVAVALYGQHGFEVEGRLREEFRQPDGTWADDLWMARFLD